MLVMILFMAVKMMTLLTVMPVMILFMEKLVMTP